MTLSPEAERKIADSKARQTAHLRGERPWVEDPGRIGPRTIGLITDVAPGWEVWTCEDGRRNWHQQPLGGIVLHVDAGAPPTVDDWGEIHKHPATFRVYDPLTPWDKAFRALTEDEVNRDSIGTADDYSVETAVKRFCHEVATAKGSLGIYECRLVTDAAALAAYLMTGGR